MCIIDNPHFDNGTPVNPPINPLLKKYPQCEMGPDYKCMYCDKCPIGSDYKVKPEDKEEYDMWQKELKNYYEANGGLNNVIFDIYWDKCGTTTEIGDRQ